MNNPSIKKYLIGAVIIIAFVAYITFSRKNSAPAVVMNTPTPPPSANEPTAATSPATSTPTASTGQYKDGTYTGSVADAFYGNLQITAVIKGGMIVDIQFPQAPSGGNSTVVSNMAEPILKQEAIAAQSAHVDTVSGATQDTEAFNQSLAVALAQAKK